MIFKEIDNMKDVEVVCHYFSNKQKLLYLEASTSIGVDVYY